MKEFELTLNEMVKQYTPEYLKELSKKHYKEDRECPECFSNWYSHIIDFGYFKHSNIVANQIFTFEETEVIHETDDINKVNWNKINEILKLTLDKMERGKIYNIKNGCFSNKYDFSTCLATKDNLAKQLWKINYISCMYDTGGETELVVRELIPYCKEETPVIYNGMPLREEVRVFYNFDKKKIEYIVDYWDYDYCYKNLDNISDKIVFNWFHNKTAGRNEGHKLKLENIKTTICEKINTLKFDDKLKGIWSIDFLNEEHNLYLVDMARGFRSAYWDESKIKEREEN